MVREKQMQQQQQLLLQRFNTSQCGGLKVVTVSILVLLSTFNLQQETKHVTTQLLQNVKANDLDYSSLNNIRVGTVGNPLHVEPNNTSTSSRSAVHVDDETDDSNVTIPITEDIKMKLIYEKYSISRHESWESSLEKFTASNIENDATIDPTVLDATQETFPVGDTFGRIIGDRLVVDANHTHMFWFDGQTRLCNVLRDMTNVDVLGSVTTERNSAPLPQRRGPLLNVTVDCQEIKKDERFGEGNWITALYCVKIAAAVAKVDMQFQCSNGRDSQMTMLLPWFDGIQLAPIDSTDNPWPYAGEAGTVQPPDEEVACTAKYPNIRVDLMSNMIRSDIRRMAIALVGSRYGGTTRQHSMNIDQSPLIPNITLDDVVIHFRCGDVMGGARRGDFGMIQFSEYKKWIIPSATQSVGIVTQPFDSKLTRGKDRGKVEACKRATYALVDYLKGFLLPNTTISIHNNENETLPLAYARLAMAKQSFTSLSSFGIFPIIGTFGDGYFQRGNRGVNPFGKYLPDFFPNVHMMKAPVISTGVMYNKIQNNCLDEILDWFVAA